LRAIDRIFFTPDAVLVVTAFESANEVNMKNYLLKPHKRLKISCGNYWIIQQSKSQESVLENLWKFIKDKYFVCLHLKYSENMLISSFTGDSEDIS